MSETERIDTETGEVTLVEVGLAEPPAVNETSDRAIVPSSFKEIVASVMNEAQFAIISGRTPRSVIKKRPGKGGKMFSYVPHGYVTNTLNKAFGFHWSFELLPNGRGDRYEVIQGIETVNAKGQKILTPTSIVVSGRLTVFIHDPNDMSKVIATFSKESTGEKEFLPGMTWGAHIKAAESDALKRCAARLGIANDLYWADTEEEALEMNGNGHRQEVVPDALTVRAREMKANGSTLGEIAAALGEAIPSVARRLR